MAKRDFEKFYREFGMRVHSTLMSTRVFPVRELCKDAVMHSLGVPDSYFPDGSNIFFQNQKTKILLKNITALLPENKTAGKVPVNHLNLTLEWLKNNKAFQNFNKSIVDAKNEDQLLVYNYDIATLGYKYSESNKFTPYFKWQDKQKLLWTTIAESCKLSSKVHFVDFIVPDEVPTKAKLDMHSQSFNSEGIKYFNTDAKLSVLDFWKWLDPELRSESVMGALEVREFRKVNLIFRTKDGRSIIVNLGYLNSWISEQPNQTDKNFVRGMQPLELRMYILKFFLNIKNLNFEIDTRERESADKSEDDRQTEEADTLGDQPREDGDSPLPLHRRKDEDEEDFIGEFAAGAVQKVPKAKDSDSGSSESESSTEPSDGDEELRAGEDSKNLEDIQKELEALEELDERRLRISKESGSDYDPSDSEPQEVLRDLVLKPRTAKERFLERLDAAVEKGKITAADYRKIQKSLEEQDKKKDPFGTGKSLLEASTVTKEDIQIDREKSKLVGDERILDDSMLESCVEGLNRDYIKKALRKEVLGSILAIQSAGVLVGDVTTEVNHSILGSDESHHLTLKPLDGRSSVIRIRYPSPDEDGTFKANGVRYTMRRQRVDLPIRMIDSTRVGLSTYYGKTSVSRSTKIAESPTAYIIKHLVKASIGEVEDVYDIKPANVFDNLFQAPFIYGAISNHYKSFSVNHKIFGKLKFDFDHTKRAELVGESVVSSIEKNGERVVGVTSKGRPIYVDMSNQFFTKLESGIQPLGDIYDILSLDRLKAPVGLASTRIMGRSLPVGLVLGRAMGFRNLLKYTGVKYRVVKARQQKNLNPYEYFVTFEDMTFIFDRRDVKNSLIFGGFENNNKYLKGFPAQAYDSKEVYDEVFNVLGSGVTVMRELDLLETSYVDNITKTILEEMKEPQTYLGLLDRSCEMLVSYTHPNSQDLQSQHLRGYERFAGTVYKELIKSVRAFRNKNISGRSKVEMSPFAVWQSIMEDRSVKTCEDINPIQNVKMHEDVTFAGEGGRDKETFMAESRAMTESDVGRFSEASKDSGDVGYNTYLSVNPKIDNLRGMTKKEDIPNKAGHYFSSSLMLAIGAAHDDFTVCLMSDCQVIDS